MNRCGVIREWMTILYSKMTCPTNVLFEPESGKSNREKSSAIDKIFSTGRLDRVEKIKAARSRPTETKGEP